MDRGAYASWIRKVRGTMSQKDFGSKICRFRNEGKIRKCCSYHRNEVINWEKGKNLPLNLEAFISIALFRFDHCHRRDEDGEEYREKRVQYVQRKMEMFLGRRLYCRNLHGALLFQVCRDILSLEEVLEIEPELEKMVQDASEELDVSQKRSYALQKETQRITDCLYQIGTKEELYSLVKQSRYFFYTGTRTFGERMVRCYEGRQRYCAPISFFAAVRIYAPNYRDSINRIFISSGMTRQWIMDLCVHLRFNRREIQHMLKNAQLVSLSEEKQDEEYYLKEYHGCPIGSAAWYQYRETNLNDDVFSHFSGYHSFTLKQKFVVFMVILALLEHAETMNAFVPVDYLLELFLQYDYGKSLLSAAETVIFQTMEEYPLWSEQINADLIAQIEDEASYLFFSWDELKTDNEKAVYQDYFEEFSAYYTFAKDSACKESSDLEGIKLRYFAATAYTVFTGKYYRGSLSQIDLDEIKLQFSRGECGGNWKTFYRFMNQILVVFAQENPPEKTRSGEYFCVLHGKETEKLTLQSIMEDTYIVLCELICTK